MYCLRYWARNVRKGKVKSGGIKIGNESASWILLFDSPFREIILIIFRNIIQFLVVLFSLLLWLHQHFLSLYKKAWFEKINLYTDVWLHLLTFVDLGRNISLHMITRRSRIASIKALTINQTLIICTSWSTAFSPGNYDNFLIWVIGRT